MVSGGQRDRAQWRRRRAGAAAGPGTVAPGESSATDEQNGGAR